MSSSWSRPGLLERFLFLEPTCHIIQGFATALYVPFRGEEFSCDGRWSFLIPGCGCGPNLQWCQTDAGLNELKGHLLDQELRVVDRAVDGSRPYTEILTDKQMEFNGPVAHYLKYQSGLVLELDAKPDATSPAPDIPSTQQEWVSVQRSGRHAGVLPTPGYLLRFASNRARAFRFYGAFECSSFIPSGPLPSPTEPCSQRLELTERCGGDSCHIKLEPMASHWGRFSEYGYANLDETNFPEVGFQKCSTFQNIDDFFDCFRHYKLDPAPEEEPFAARLNAYVFRSEEEIAAIEQGPGLLAQQAIDSGRFGACTVRRMWTQFMRREPTIDEEENVLPELASDFAQQGYNIKALVKRIVLHPAYGREL